jgi:hypothetical protein
MVDERSQAAIEMAKRHAAGMATDEELRAAARAAGDAHQELFGVLGKTGSCIEWAAAFAANLNPSFAAKNTRWAVEYPREYEVRRPRPNDFDEINYFPCRVRRRKGLSALLSGRWYVEPIEKFEPTGADKAVQAALLRCIFGNPFRPAMLDGSWLTPTVVQLARGAFEERRLPSGELDPGRLAVLGDALEEAGCTDGALLGHLRGPGPHVRGCFAVDLLIGQS